MIGFLHPPPPLRFQQARVRESLVNLLTAFGQRVGLPKSPSVSFHQLIHGFRVFLSGMN